MINVFDHPASELLSLAALSGSKRPYNLDTQSPEGNRRMKRLSCTLGLGIAILLFGVAGLAQAVPITYTQTGIATGTIGGSVFTNALVTLTATGDTDNVIDLGGTEDDGFVIPFGIFFGNPISATVNIAGIGIATITDPSAVYAISVSVDIDEDGDDDPPVVIFGTVDDPPALGSFTGLGGTASNSLAGYDLRTATGPITSFGGVGRSPTGEGINTTLGVLRFASDIDIDSSQGTFTATTVSRVPEPGSLLLLGTGIVSFIGSRFRGRRRTTSN